MQHPRFILICIVVFLSAGTWGLYWLPQRLLLEAGLTGGWGTILQYVLSLIILMPIAIWRYLTGKKIGFQYWACGLLLGSGAIFYANSFLGTEVIRALVFFYLTPLWATLVEIIFLKRFPRWPRITSIGLALSGVWITVGLDVGVPIPTNIGDWFGLIGGLLVAAGAARTEIEQPEGIFPILFIVMIFCTLASILQYPLLAESLGALPTIDTIKTSLPFLLGISVLFIIPTTAIIFWSPSRVGTGVFGILILSELIVGVISAAILTDEAFGWREIVGASLILLAGIVEVTLSRSSEAQETSPAPSN